MFVVNRHHSSPEAVIYLKIDGWSNTNCFPRSTLDIVRGCSQYAIHRVSFVYKIIPEDAEILTIKLEDRVIYKIPWSWLTCCSRWILTLAVPCACFHIEYPYAFFGSDWSWIYQACIGCASNNKHAKSVKCNTHMSLSSHCCVITSVFNFINFVSRGIEKFHRIQDLALFIDASI